MTLFQKVDPEFNFPKEEAKTLAFWKANRIFEQSLELRNRPGAESFVFYEGPPTANGMPHNGHVLTRVIKDVFPRYQTMRGRYVTRKGGWDTHGLPVEVEVEKELRIHGKAAIEEYGVQPFISRCIDSVFRYTKEWEELTEKIGFWVDLPNAYVTYHQSYVESVWWALSQLFEKGLLYQGHKVVWWWAQGGTALSAAEVGQGYKTVDDPSVYVAFPLVDAPGTSLLVWTTTPWTLPSNSYAAVRADYEYSFVTHAEQTLVVASGLREALAKKLKSDLPVTKTVKGSELVGLRYRPPFDLYAREPNYFRVIDAEFVTLDSGTGIVHIAPAFGQDDFAAHQKQTLAKNQSPLLCAVKPDGTFIDEMGKYKGRWVKECDKELTLELKEKRLLVHTEQIRHEYPFCPRADQDALIQFARPAWYIRTTREIGRVLDNNAQVSWLPEHIKDGRMGDFLRNNVDWALSRERYWGTPLNVWVCDKNADHKRAPSSVAEIESLNPKAFDHFRAAQRENPALNSHLIVHKPWIDAVTLPCSCGGTMRRVTEVIDCWFDSGCMPFAQWGFPHQDGSIEKLRSHFPAHFISEAIDQTRGWFYALEMISTLVFDRKTLDQYRLSERKAHPFETCIVLGHVCDKEGKKESKSKGNYTPPDIVYGEVKLDFAVVDGNTEVGTVAIAAEDCDGLDVRVGATLLASGPKGSLPLKVVTPKGMKRRLAVLHANDRATLGLSVTKGNTPMPAEVPRLPREERVTLKDESTPAPGADAFRWFFYASSPPWSNTRHALSNVRTLQREFLVKLRNTYSFFTIYANIDGFDPTQKNQELQHTELDRWILSELAQLVNEVTADLDTFKIYEATGRLTAFADALSNWYLRRSRDRFWSAGFTPDKRAAYQTLYQCLLTTSQLIAPFVPFFAEAMYQNLKRPHGSALPASVHLCDWPQADARAIDPDLSKKMSAVRDLVSLGLQARATAKLKVRQPLRKALVILSKSSMEATLADVIEPMKEELNVLAIEFVPHARSDQYVERVLKPNFRTLGQRGLGKEAQALKASMATLGSERAAALHAELLEKGSVTLNGVTLSPEDVEVSFVTKGSLAASGGRTGVVLLDTALDEDLLERGFIRELQSKIQAARKNLGLEFTDRITLGLSGGPRLERALPKFKESLMAEVLCSELIAAVGQGETVDVDGEAIRLSVTKQTSA